MSKQFHGLAQYSRVLRAGDAVLKEPADRAADSVLALRAGGEAVVRGKWGLEGF